VKRGEVYIANLVPRSGSEQKGKRPVIIVSHDGFNLTPGWRSMIIVPISTSTAQKKSGPTAVLLPAGAAGLKKTSVALCHQVTTLDRSKLGKRIGTLTDELLQQVESGLLAALDLFRWE
jgi:mRNA interferase MazF